MNRRDVLRRAGAIGSVAVAASAPVAGSRLTPTESGESCYGGDGRRSRQRASDLVDWTFEITDVSTVPPGLLTSLAVDVTFDSRSQVTVVGTDVPRPCRDVALAFVDYTPRTREVVVGTTFSGPSDQPVACIPERQVQSYEATVSVEDHTIDRVTVVHNCEEVESVSRGERDA